MEPGPGGFRTFRLIACGLAGALGLALVLLSYLPDKPIYPSGLVIVVFVSVFPLFGWALIDQIRLQAGRPRRRWNDLKGLSSDDDNRRWTLVFSFAKGHQRLLALAIPLGIGLWVIMMSSVVTLRGQPTHDQAGYYLNDHGNRIPVTRSGYEAAVAKQDRLFAAGASVFLLAACGMTMYRPNTPDGEHQGLS